MVEPLTAADVKFTFENAANSGSVIDLNVLEKVEVVDPMNGEIHFKRSAIHICE